MSKYRKKKFLPKFLAAGALLAINIIAASALADNFQTGYTAYQKGEFKVAAKERYFKTDADYLYFHSMMSDFFRLAVFLVLDPP